MWIFIFQYHWFLLKSDVLCIIYLKTLRKVYSFIRMPEGSMVKKVVKSHSVPEGSWWGHSNLCRGASASRYGWQQEGVAGLLRVIISSSSTDLLFQPGLAPSSARALGRCWAGFWAVVGLVNLQHRARAYCVLHGLGFHLLFNSPSTKLWPTQTRIVVASWCKWGLRELLPQTKQESGRLKSTGSFLGATTSFSCDSG